MRWPSSSNGPRGEADLDLSGARSASDGTIALLPALRSLGIGAGDEVVTPPNSFVASTSSIALLGATSRLADAGDDANVDPLSVRERVNERTSAVIVVHLTGSPGAIDETKRLAAERDLLAEAGPLTPTSSVASAPLGRHYVIKVRAITVITVITVITATTATMPPAV